MELMEFITIIVLIGYMVGTLWAGSIIIDGVVAKTITLKEFIVFSVWFPIAGVGSIMVLAASAAVMAVLSLVEWVVLSISELICKGVDKLTEKSQS
jgi:hypothetical protein